MSIPRQSRQRKRVTSKVWALRVWTSQVWASRVRTCALAMGLSVGATGCEDEVVVNAPPPVQPADPTPVAEETPLVAPDAGVVARSYTDDDFVELDVRNRDPFRNFATAFQPTGANEARVSRNVKMPNTAIDDMRVIAIVTRISPPRAMIQDGSGVGYVVRPPDFIGRPEAVQVGSDVPVQLQWQVARVRPGEVVLTRADPTAPDRPPLTRILPLHADEADGQTELRVR